MRPERCQDAKFNSWLYASARSALENEQFPEIFCPGHLAFLTLVPALVDGTRREGTNPAGVEPRSPIRLMPATISGTPACRLASPSHPSVGPRRWARWAP